MPNNYWNIKEFNIRKYLPYFNAFLVIYVFLNNFHLTINSSLEKWQFITYCIGIVTVLFLSPIAWVKSKNVLVWLCRVMVLIALAKISLYSPSQTVFYLYYLQIIGITLWYSNRREFIVGTIILTLTCIFFSFLNNFFKSDIIKSCLLVVIINFSLASFLYRQNETQQKLRELYKIFSLTLDNTNTGIQFIDAEGRTRILNPAAEVIYGRPQSEVQGKFDWELYYYGKKYDENGNYISLITESLETGIKHKDVERVFQDEHGKKKIYLVETFRVYCDLEDKIIGAMGIYRDITAQKEMERQLLDAHYEMANMAVTDELTKLYNVRYFRQRLTTEVAKAYKSELSLLIIDIDHFKIYNDLFGHLEGDKVLRKIGAILKDSFRATDVVARYGGEEFSVILPEMNKEKAKEVADRIRVKIRETPIEGEEQLPGGKLTVTIGVASVPDDAKTAEDLIGIADDALYHGKYGSRDIVVTFGENSEISNAH
ncbi:MAG: diguanylate cyclase [Peptococcales bacterium]|jgi:diguanylate cyclase (GGDEF)-like protein/PAS domain S-box-containing protein